MAPGQDGEWVDTAGCNDNDSRKKTVLRKELEAAKQVAVVVRMNLGTSKGTVEHLCGTTLPARVVAVAMEGVGVGGPAAPIRADNTMMVIHNRELVGLSIPLLNQAGFDADAVKNFGERHAISRDELRNEILNDALNDAFEDEDDPGRDEVLDRIPLLSPAVSLFTSLVLRDEPFGESEDVRQEQLQARQTLLDSTGGYELIGTLELFLKAGSRASVEELFRVVKGAEDEPGGLLAALEQVKRNQQSRASAAVKKKELVAAWKKKSPQLDSMRAAFKVCLNQLADNFSRTFRDEVGSGTPAAPSQFLAQIKDEFDRTCRKISTRRSERDRVVSNVDEYFTNLESMVEQLLKKHVKALQESLGSEFRPVVEREIVSFVREQVLALKLPGDNKERILDIEKMATYKVGARFKSAGFPKVVDEEFQRAFKEVFSELSFSYHAQLNQLDDESRKEFLSPEKFTDQLHVFVEAAERVVDLVRMSLTCPGGCNGVVYLNFMLQLDMAPVRMERRGGGLGSSINVLGELANGVEKLLFEEANWSQRDEERLQDLTAFCATLEKVVKMWGENKEQIGKDLFEDYRSNRLMDQLSVVSRFRSTSAPLLDETPSQANCGKHNLHRGYLPIVGSKVQRPSAAVADIWRKATATDRSEGGNVQKLKEALKHNTRGKLVFVKDVQSEPHPDEFFASFLIVALDYSLEEARQPETLMHLRQLILCEASRRKEYATVLLATHGGLGAFGDFILDINKCPDLLALCFLSEVFQRRLNLYVPWKTSVSADQDETSPPADEELLPLRIRPRQLVDATGEETGHTNADAVVLLGAANGGHFMRMCTARQSLFKLEALENPDGDDDADEDISEGEEGGRDAEASSEQGGEQERSGSEYGGVGREQDGGRARGEGFQAGGGGARAMSEALLPAAAGVASLSPRNETQEALLDGIERVSAIINGGEVDSIGALLRQGALDPAVEKCFLGDGKWDPEQQEFEGAPDWDCVRAALAILSTTLLEEHRTVHALSPHAVCMCPPE